MILPSITACIPLYNHENWVLDCLKSMATQTYDNLKIVLCDDGSTDNGFEVVKSQIKDIQNGQIGQSDEPGEIVGGLYEGRQIIAIRFNHNHGPSLCRNYMIQTALDDTDIFAFCDSDDWYGKEKVSKSVQYFLDNPFVGVVYSDYSTIDKNGNSHIQYKEPFSKARLAQECLPNMDSLISVQCFKDCGMFDESLRVAEDLDRWLAFAPKFLFCHIPDYTLLNIRVGSHSSTDMVDKQIWLDNVNRVRNKQR